MADIMPVGRVSWRGRTQWRAPMHEMPQPATIVRADLAKATQAGRGSLLSGCHMPWNAGPDALSACS
ncbi:hypothetical protein [Komagataeibacter swingsii]|uniref:Uncharacterized protein n=1 Tax=Komagataeibacter swingsii TaxID=215220 RepID=A0A850P5J5_9PROT|nr:hypothetical protein [Komagataeibacter swingsii]NVN37880.1 hypothetical protein [Komagataeibacter swingsii]